MEKEELKSMEGISALAEVRVFGIGPDCIGRASTIEFARA